MVDSDPVHRKAQATRPAGPGGSASRDKVLARDYAGDSDSETRLTT